MAKVKAGYVDGFVMVIYKDKLAAYKKMATVGAKVWRKHGALDYKECVGDDLNPPYGLPFTKLLKLKPNEVAVFAFVTYKSKKHRDLVNKKVMHDPLMNDPKYKDLPMPFDMKRMAYGGFKVLVGN